MYVCGLSLCSAPETITTLSALAELRYEIKRVLKSLRQEYLIMYLVPK